MAKKIGVQAVLETAEFLSGLAQYMGGLQQAERSTQQFAQTAQGEGSRGVDMFAQVAIGAFRRIGEAAIDAAAKAVQAIGNIVGAAVSGALEAENVEARLGIVITAMGDATDLTIDQANDLADANRDLFRGDDELARSVIQVGLSMGTVSADQMPTFLRQVADLAAVTGTDAPSAARMFAQAYEDPISTLRRFRAQNIMVDQSTQDTIRRLVEQGNTAEAAALLMDRVGQSTAGAAETMADTVEGRLAIFRGHMGDTAEDIAGSFLDALDEPLQQLTPQIEEVFGQLADWLTRPEVVQGFQDLLIGALNLFEALREGPDENSPFMRFLRRMQEWWATYGPGIQKAGQALFDRLRDAVARVSEKIGPFIEKVLNRLAEWWEENGPLIQEYVRVTSERFAAIFEGLMEAWDVVQPILGGLIELVLGIVTTIMALATGDWALAWETIKATAGEVWEAIKLAIAEFADWVRGWFETTWQDIKDQWAENWEMFKVIVEDLWENIKTAIQTKAAEIVAEMGTFVANITTAISDKIGEIVAVGQSIVTGLWSGISSRIAWLREQISRGMQSVIDLVRSLFGSESPSTLFEGIGIDLMLGLAGGIQTGVPAAAGAMRTAAGMVTAPAAGASTVNRQRTTNVNMNFSANYAQTQSPVTVRHDVAALLAGVRRG